MTDTATTEKTRSEQREEGLRSFFANNTEAVYMVSAPSSIHEELYETARDIFVDVVEQGGNADTIETKAVEYAGGRFIWYTECRTLWAEWQTQGPNNGDELDHREYEELDSFMVDYVMVAAADIVQGLAYRAFEGWETLSATEREAEAPHRCPWREGGPHLGAPYCDTCTDLADEGEGDTDGE